MLLREIIILTSCCFLYSCSDYPSGYKDGYGSNGKRQWIVFGKADYLEGFHEGKADKFQQEWFAENLSDINQLQCPVVTILEDPFNYLPADYKRVGPDIYKRYSQ